MHAVIERATSRDADAVHRLLTENRLPLDGFAEHLHTAFVARQDDRVVGSAALEIYADGALLRSVAVAAPVRGEGVGQALTQAALRYAADQNLPAVYLLTTTAERFFPRFGFERIAREDVPASVQTSVEFTSACPASAIVMRRQLTRRAISDYVIRAATLEDLPALTDIYNHYVVHTAITFDLQPFAAHERRAWFDDHKTSGPHRLLVAADAGGVCLGYASTSRWRPKPAYSPTVEASVYCHPDATGKKCGTRLYAALFDSLQSEDVHTIVAGVALPNPASIALHQRFGFQAVGVFHAVGRKFGKLWDVAWFERLLRMDAASS
jgi:phosphinothricin acetyltransferase